MTVNIGCHIWPLIISSVYWNCCQGINKNGGAANIAVPPYTYKYLNKIRLKSVRFRRSPYPVYPLRAALREDHLKGSSYGAAEIEE